MGNTAFPFFICFLSVITLSIESLNWTREGEKKREREWHTQRDSFVSIQTDSWWVLMILVVNFDAGNSDMFRD